MNQTILAVDLGGTKTAAAIVSSSGDILSRVEEPTCQQGPEEGIRQIERMLRDMARCSNQPLEQARCVGIGIPAVLEAETDRVIWAPNLQGWRNVDLRGKLQAQLGLPVTVEYDGHTAVLGEWWVGAGRGCRSIVYLIVGTGIGGGMILEGRLIRGKNRLAGAAGWFGLTSDANAQDEQARLIGHWESLAAGPGIARRAREGLDLHPESQLWAAAEEREITCADVFAAAQAGDAYASALTAQLSDWLGLGIANIVSLVNPERVILGGGVGSHTGFLLDDIQAAMRRWAQPISAQSVQILISLLGSDAGLVGAAYGALLRQQAVERL